MLHTPDPTLPHGFRPTASGSGLLVPDEQSREREVWTKDESRLVERAAKFLRSKGLDVYYGCSDPRCKSTEGKLNHKYVKGQLVLECGHKTRVLSRAF